MLIVVLVVTVLFVLFLRTNPTGREFFDPARTCQNLIGVKLLIVTNTSRKHPSSQTKRARRENIVILDGLKQEFNSLMM